MAFWGLFDKKLSFRESGILQGNTDRHSHILYGVDDGIKTLEDSLEALAIHEDMGVTQVWCTPHIMEDVPNNTADLKVRFEQLCSAYKGKMKLSLAAEYMLDTLFDVRLENRDLLTMDDDMLLVETSTLNPPFDYKDIFMRIMAAGYRPLLAHPERYRYMTNSDYDQLKQMGVLFQMNIPSVLGYYGKNVKQKATYLLRKGYYDHIGTDCHRAKALLEPYDRKLLTKKECSILKNI